MCVCVCCITCTYVHTHTRYSHGPRCTHVFHIKPLTLPVLFTFGDVLLAAATAAVGGGGRCMRVGIDVSMCLRVRSTHTHTYRSLVIALGAHGIVHNATRDSHLNIRRCSHRHAERISTTMTSVDTLVSLYIETSVPPRPPPNGCRQLFGAWTHILLQN